MAEEASVRGDCTSRLAGKTPTHPSCRGRVAKGGRVRPLLLALLVVLPSTALARNYERESLAFADSVEVLVEDIPSQLSAALSDTAIKAAVETILRSHGIPLTESVMKPCLYININGVEAVPKTLTESINIQLDQPVVLLSDESKQQVFSGSTWNKGSMISGPESTAGRRTARAIAELLTIFINDWQATHPKSKGN